MSNDLKKQTIRIYKIFLFSALFIFIVSCNGQKKTATKQIAQNDAKMLLVDQNEYSGADSTETMLITNAKELKLFYSRINRTRKPGLPVPDIDFSKNIVVVLCSADDSFSVEQKLSVLNETNSELVIGMKKSAAVQGEISSSISKSRVSPFFVYTMPLTYKKVTFELIK